MNNFKEEEDELDAKKEYRQKFTRHTKRGDDLHEQSFPIAGQENYDSKSFDWPLVPPTGTRLILKQVYTPADDLIKEWEQMSKY
jgi:hypothetical protein